MLVSHRPKAILIIGLFSLNTHHYYWSASPICMIAYGTPQDQQHCCVRYRSSLGTAVFSAPVGRSVDRVPAHQRALVTEKDGQQRRAKIVVFMCTQTTKNRYSSKTKNKSAFKNEHTLSSTDATKTWCRPGQTPGQTIHKLTPKYPQERFLYD